MCLLGYFCLALLIIRANRNMYMHLLCERRRLRRDCEDAQADLIFVVFLYKQGTLDDTVPGPSGQPKLHVALCLGDYFCLVGSLSITLYSKNSAYNNQRPYAAPDLVPHILPYFTINVSVFKKIGHLLHNLASHK